jgi:hypothetical protein
VALCLGWLGASALAAAQEPPGGAPPTVFPAVIPADAPAQPEQAPAPLPAAPTAPAKPDAQPGAPVPAVPEGAVVPTPYPGPYFAPPVFTPTTSGNAGPDNAFQVDPLPHIPPNRFHADFEYLLWILPRQPVPVLFTTGAVGDLVPGALGQPNTKVLLDAVPDGSFKFNGGQVAFGYDLDCEGDCSIQASFFILEHRSAVLQASSSGAANSTLIARPFFNIVANTQDADPVSFPSVQSGVAQVALPQRLFGGDIAGRYTFLNSTAWSTRLSLLAGARYLSLDEKLLIGEQIQDVPGLGVPGNNYALSENFTTYNRFYGGQVGGQIACLLGPLTVDLVGKLNVGPMRETVSVGAFTRIIEPDGTITTGNNQGLLVGPGNAGRFRHTEIAFVPEGSARISLAFNDNVSLMVGYSFIYFDRVVRPGNQIDRNVNVMPVGATGPVGPVAPVGPFFSTSTFWAQGLDIGLQFRF